MMLCSLSLRRDVLALMANLLSGLNEREASTLLF